MKLQLNCGFCAATDFCGRSHTHFIISLDAIRLSDDWNELMKTERNGD